MSHSCFLHILCYTGDDFYGGAAEDPSKCSAIVLLKEGQRQCKAKKAHGCFCRQHAKRHRNKQRIIIPWHKRNDI